MDIHNKCIILNDYSQCYVKISVACKTVKCPRKPSLVSPIPNPNHLLWHKFSDLLCWTSLSSANMCSSTNGHCISLSTLLKLAQPTSIVVTELPWLLMATGSLHWTPTGVLEHRPWQHRSRAKASLKSELKA